jgi:CHAD domain-containing protein
MPRKSPAPPDRDLRAELAGRLRGRHAVLLRSVDEFLRASYPTPERVHRLHSDLRRLRTEFRFWRSTLGSVAAEHARAIDRRLAETSRRTGEVRDADVQLELLDRFLPQVDSKPDRELGEQLLHRFRDDCHIGRELLRAYLRAESDTGMFSELRRSLEDPPGRTPRPLRVEDLTGPVDVARERLWKAYRRARRRTSIQRAHRLRIRLRRMRYVIDFLSAIRGSGLGAYPGRLVRLQRLLGRLHDLDLRAEWVGAFSGALRNAPTGREVLEEHRTLRRELREELRAKATRNAIRRVGRSA